MYENFYGLSSDPFRLSPSARPCFEHETYRKAKSYMVYALRRGEGVLLVTGLPGTGKSSLVREYIREVSGSRHLVVELVASRLDADDLLRLIAARFDVGSDDSPRASLLAGLESRFRSLRAEGRRAILVIDEAQGLTTDALEEIRSLTNLQDGEEPLLQVFLVGQPALAETIRTPGLEQFHQRILAACRIEPLEEEEVKAYVEHCLSASGWKGAPAIDDDVYEAIHRASLGVPRRVNLICSRMLLRGMADGSHHLSAQDAEAVLEDLRYEGLLAERAPEGRADATRERGE